MANECLVNQMLRICQDKQDVMLGQEALKNIGCDLLSQTDGLRLDVASGSAERDRKFRP